MCTQAQQNDEKRKQASQRLAAAYAANVAILQNKRDEFHWREADSEARREKQAHEQSELEHKKQEASTRKAQKRKVRFSGFSSGCPWAATDCLLSLLQVVYNQAVKQQQDRVAAILENAANQQTIMEGERERQCRELARRRLQRQLNAEYRMECVDTIRKQQLHSRDFILQKIAAQTDRILMQRRDAGVAQCSLLLWRA